MSVVCNNSLINLRPLPLVRESRGQLPRGIGPHFRPLAEGSGVAGGDQPHLRRAVVGRRRRPWRGTPARLGGARVATLGVPYRSARAGDRRTDPPR